MSSAAFVASFGSLYLPLGTATPVPSLVLTNRDTVDARGEGILIAYKISLLTTNTISCAHFQHAHSVLQGKPGASILGSSSGGFTFNFRSHGAFGGRADLGDEAFPGAV